MINTIEQTFNTIYSKIAKKENLIKPVGSSIGNYGIDTFKFGDYKATMGDGGYFKTVSCVSEGKVIWCVTETSNNSGSKYSFRGISEDQFVTGVAPLIESTL